ncbi:MAG: hypothetical protein QG633_442 [Patescibacteria group bacterium]|jgi:hypothetical protein|nr:hypothetical protein [Patescibacteria group bacterium]
MNTTLLNRWKKALGFTVTGLLLVGAMLVTAPKAQAATMTIAELQAQVELLLAQLAAIQGNTSTSCFEFSRDLTVGSTGPDVSALQNYLKTTDHFPFAVGTTGYFGDVTRSAVAAWQSSNGLVPPAGYFGQLSRARYALLCQPVNTTPTQTGDDDDDDDNDSNAISAENAIDDAEMAIDDARQEVDDADDDGDDVDDANDLLDDAEAKLEDAQGAFAADDFEEAENLANDASDLADDAVDAIDEDNDGDTSVESTSAVSPVGNNKDRADYEIEFTLNAFNGDFYIPRSTERDDDESDGSDGIEFYLEESSGAVYTGGDVAAAFSADGSNNGDTDDYFKIDDNESRTFTLNVSLDNEGATAGFYGLQINAIRFDSNTTAGGEITISNGLNDHDTKVVFVDDEN